MSDLTRQQFGNYRLIRLLGQGGFADTYLGEQIYLRTYAAMKIVQTQLAQDDQGTFFSRSTDHRVSEAPEYCASA